MKIYIEEYDKIPYEQRNEKYEVEDIGTFYYVNGNFHRENGPAIQYIDGTKFWCINGKRHRLDGPAIEWSYGTKEYFIEDKYYHTKEELEAAAYMYLNGLQDYL